MELQATTIFFICLACFSVGVFGCRWPESLPRQFFGRWESCLPCLTRRRRRTWINIPHRTLHFWECQRITLLHYVIPLSYAIGNVFFFLKLGDLEEIQRRAAVAAILNLVPVILGGRTRFLASVFNLSLQQYYILHHCLAWIAIMEALLHGGINFRDGMPKTGQAICGLLVRRPADIIGHT